MMLNNRTCKIVNWRMYDMPKLIKQLVISLAIFAAFSISGHIAMYLESWHESILASSAVFSASFASLVGGGTKIWYDILA